MGMKELFPFIFPIFLCVLFLITSYIFYNKIYCKFKIKTSKESLEELLFVLKTAINTEIDLYEKNIFNNKGAITNSNFDNFYNDIVYSIINSLSDDFFFKINIYIKKEAVISIICRNVKNYLTEKITGVV